jgi:hypothetical protein
MLIGGVILILVAIGLLYASTSQRRGSDSIRGTETLTVADLHALVDAVASGIGAGSFQKTAAMKGKIECEQPLVSELSESACVYYSMSVTREFEETYWDNDSEGRRSQKTRRGSETVAENTRSVLFDVVDQTGRIRVDPSGAAFVAEKMVTRFEPGDPSAARWRFGTLEIGVSRPSLAFDRKTIGYRYEESAIPVGQQIYVIGGATDVGGGLRIRKPLQKGAQFIVSLQGQEKLVQSAETASRGLTIASGLAALSGITIVVIQLVRGVA